MTQFSKLIKIVTSTKKPYPQKVNFLLCFNWYIVLSLTLVMWVFKFDPQGISGIDIVHVNSSGWKLKFFLGQLCSLGVY